MYRGIVKSRENLRELGSARWFGSRGATTWCAPVENSVLANVRILGAGAPFVPLSRPVVCLGVPKRDATPSPKFGRVSSKTFSRSQLCSLPGGGSTFALRWQRLEVSNLAPKPP
jgi:hypothetical protein